MGSSYISNHIHVVFSTKNRVRSIDEKTQPRLWAYMAGIAEHHGMHAVSIAGIDDHVHLLINLGIRVPGSNGRKDTSPAASPVPRWRV